MLFDTSLPNDTHFTIYSKKQPCRNSLNTWYLQGCLLRVLSMLLTSSHWKITEINIMFTSHIYRQLHLHQSYIVKKTVQRVCRSSPAGFFPFPQLIVYTAYMTIICQTYCDIVNFSTPRQGVLKFNLFLIFLINQNLTSSAVSTVSKVYPCPLM